MRIEFVEIQNFRKLKACRIEIGEKETVFVGANNSGKTSAMHALIMFLKKDRHKDLATTDFTLSNWRSINGIAEQWTLSTDGGSGLPTVAELQQYLPSIDVWIKAEADDLHRVVHLLPTLNWRPEESLGVRLLFAPKDMEQLYKEFISEYKSARKTERSSNGDSKVLTLWPSSMRDFLDRRLHSQFEVKSFILDPSKCEDPEDGIARPQSILPNSNSLGTNPLKGLVKIDVITAQRGFSDPKAVDASSDGISKLSAQLGRYFNKHLDPSKTPGQGDIKALVAIAQATDAFNETLETSFKPALNELEGLNYPGFSDPRISISSKIDPSDSLNHKAAVQYSLPGSDSLRLPEQYNGLGYQNLISMVFYLIRFRDEWMRVGKAASALNPADSAIEPLHVVLVEEPEAHLHPQIQQVFIKKAYEVLREHDNLRDSPLSTQMIISTHSSHIAHELELSCLRYFRREPVRTEGQVPTATVINLSKTFGDIDETSKFAARYLRTTHCDLFFADAAILVEGSAERMLIPYFISKKYCVLDRCYISLLEIGGSHAHRLRPLMDALGLLCLVITDLDPIRENGAEKARLERDKGYRTSNSTLKSWVPHKELLDELFDLTDKQKQSENGLVRVAYQCPIALSNNEDEFEGEAVPYTFEDSLAWTNREMFLEIEGSKGLLKKLQEALKQEIIENAENHMFKALKRGKKAEMALELLYLSEPNKLEPPRYIADGLKWLQTSIENRRDGISTESVEEKDV